jgi:hypothetical protein
MLILRLPIHLAQELACVEETELPLTHASHSSQTRQKLKEAFNAELLATIERAEKQIVLAKHGRRLLALLDASPIVPGDMRPAYDHAQQTRQILNDAEDDLRDWQLELEDYDKYENMQTKRSTSGSLTLKGSMNQEESVQHNDAPPVGAAKSANNTTGDIHDEQRVVGG